MRELIEDLRIHDLRRSLGSWQAAMGARRIWIFKSYPERQDNMLCAAVALEQALIVKTVMHHFQPE